jgi:hypothetical protein
LDRFSRIGPGVDLGKSALTGCIGVRVVAAPKKCNPEGRIMLEQLIAQTPTPPFWQELLQRISNNIIMLVITTVASFIFGRWWGNRQAHREWQRKEFYNRINISLNILTEGRLKIRTIMERSLEQVFTNKIAVEKVMAASQKTTIANPMLPIAKEDSWYLLNFVLNAVAEHFSAGQVRQDAGVPVTKIAYVICLTCEVVGEERIRKVRAMMVRQDVLENFPYKDGMPELENPWHETRVQTIRTASEQYKTNPENFIKFEVCI